MPLFSFVSFTERSQSLLNKAAKPRHTQFHAPKAFWTRQPNLGTHNFMRLKPFEQGSQTFSWHKWWFCWEFRFWTFLLNPPLNLFLKQMVVLLRAPLLNLSLESSFEPFLNTNGGFAQGPAWTFLLNPPLNLFLKQMVVWLRVPLLNLSFEPSLEPFLNANDSMRMILPQVHLRKPCYDFSFV